MNCLLNQQPEVGACLTVVEVGAPGGAEAHDGVDGASARAVVVQQDDETPAELALRATRRTTRLIRNGTALEAGVIIVGDESGDDMFLSRCQIARVMIRAMRGAIAPRLIFIAPSSISDEARHELFSIAGTLATQLHGTSIEVSVRFSEQRRWSTGTHRRAVPLRERSAAARESLDFVATDVA